MTARKPRRPQPGKVDESSIGTSILDRALEAAQDRCFEEMRNETSRCKASTWKAINAAQSDRKLSALNDGLKEWEERLCAVATRYCRTCFKLIQSNPVHLAGKEPADFAEETTAIGLAIFLRVSTLDGHEEGPTGLMREFIRLVVFGDPSSTSVFQLPDWAARRSFGARIDGTFGTVQTERFILDAEAKLLKGLRKALARAHREALIETGMTPLPSGDSHLSSSKRPQRNPKLKSPLRKAIFSCLIQNSEASDKEILTHLQQNDPKVIPVNWDKDDSLPGKTFSKVRTKISAKPSTAITRH